MSPKQKKIIEILTDNETADLDLIYDFVNWSYYRNWRKYLGMLLSNMVERGMIERVKPGTFKLAKPKQKIKEEIKDPNQIEMF